jgi:diguanylate cyclase (GGDEF)-like protein
MPAPSSLTLSRRVPASAVAISVIALAIPIPASILAPDSVREYTLLLWLLAIVPAFLLAYYRGWQGAAAALAGGMVVLSTGQVILLQLGRELGNWVVMVAGVVLFTAISLGIGLVTELLHRAREEAAALALTDELTGLPNRRYARLILEKEFEAARRGRPLVVVLFDLDRFKDYNDIHGHAAGDDALRSFAGTLASTTRKMNISARFGGEEFLSVVSSAELNGALIFAERARAALADSQPGRGHITVSAGLAAYEPGMKSPDDLLAAADRALYLAKAAGRDCVRTARPADTAAGPAAEAAALPLTPLAP